MDDEIVCAPANYVRQRIRAIDDSFSSVATCNEDWPKLLKAFMAEMSEYEPRKTDAFENNYYHLSELEDAWNRLMGVMGFQYIE
jgi:hypothetical protein